LQVEQMMSD